MNASLLSSISAFILTSYKGLFGSSLSLNQCRKALKTSLSILLILTAFRSERYLGRVLGTLISSGIVTAYILFRIFQRARPRINTEFWRYGLKISLPIVPHGLSQILLSSFDRLMIKAQIGDTQAGIYSFAYTVGTIFTVVGSSLDTAWAQWFYDQMEKKNLGKIRRVASIYGTLMSAAAMQCVT